MDVVQGEIVALVEITEEGTDDTPGLKRLAAVCATARGPELGVLVGPRNGSAGQVGFEPIARFNEAISNSEELQAIVDEFTPEVEDIGPDPNDPRGLRGRSVRRPGMR